MTIFIRMRKRRRTIIARLHSPAFDNAQLAANYHAGVDTSNYELHASLATALNNPNAFKRWKRGESVFPEVADKVTLAEMMAPVEAIGQATLSEASLPRSALPQS